MISQAEREHVERCLRICKETGARGNTPQAMANDIAIKGFETVLEIFERENKGIPVNPT